MNASVYRNTRFEIRLIQQGPNSFGLICSVRSKPGKNVTLEIPEEVFTDKEMTKVHETLELLENKFAEVYDEWVANPQNILNQLTDTEAELERVKSEAAAEKRRLEAELKKSQQRNIDLITIKS